GLRHIGESIAHPMHAAALPAGAEHPADRRFEPLMGVGDDQLDPTQAAPRQALQKRRPERLSLRGTDVQPDDLASAVGVGGDSDYCRHRHDAAALTLLQVSGIEPQIRPLAGERAVEKRMHAPADLPRLRGGRLLHSLETCDLLIPDSPIACTRSSTRRVDTPPIHASWMTAISAFSELLRASRNGGK